MFAKPVIETLRPPPAYAQVSGGIVPPPALVKTMDQQQLLSTHSTAVDASTYRAQLFTAGLTGPLSCIALELVGLRFVLKSNVVEVQIRTASGGVPTSTILGSASISGSQIPLPITIQIPLTGVNVVAGTQYAIVLVPDSGGFGWRTQQPAVLADPTAFGNDSSGWTSLNDTTLVFKTWVSV